MTAFVLNTPPEVVQEIVLFAVHGDSRVGPPSVLYALLLTCRAFYRTLASSSLYADIFEYKFDLGAPIRRLGRDWLSPDNTKLELQQRFLALQCFQRGRLDDAELPNALLVAYLMVLEDDGLNSAQLRWAGLPSLLQAFNRRSLFDRRKENNGWPLENEMTSLVLSLTWLLSTCSRSDDRNTNYCLGAYTFAAFRYPCSNVPEHQFHADTVQGPYPPARVRPREVVHYGQIIRVQMPPVSVSALLSYFSTKTPLAIAAIETNSVFDLRAEANAVGSHGPTREDVDLVNSGHRIRNVNASHGSFGLLTSQMRDPDWARAIQYLSPPPVLSLDLLAAHTLGALTGCWKGTSITPGVYEYTDWLSNVTAPASFDACSSRRPLFFTLQEHFCHIPALPVPPDDDENGLINAWLPPTYQWYESEGGINISDQRGTFQAFYETCPPDSSPDGRHVLDIIVTGKTNNRHDAAWGGYTFIGRVRLSDGLIILLREPINPEITGGGKVLLRGYITSSHFVGRWRGVSNHNPAPLETAFSFCKDDGLDASGEIY